MFLGLWNLFKMYLTLSYDAIFVIPALGTRRQDQEFKVILHYIASFKPAWAMRLSLSPPVSFSHILKLGTCYPLACYYVLLYDIMASVLGSVNMPSSAVFFWAK